jgi:hypothetical protein
LAVVWPSSQNRVEGEKAVERVGQSLEIHIAPLADDARADVIRDFTGDGPWYRANELEKLSRIEAQTFATRFADRVAAKTALTAEVRSALQQSLAQALLDHFLKTDGRPTVALKKRLLDVAARHLDSTGLASFEAAIKSGSKRQQGDSI